MIAAVLGIVFFLIVTLTFRIWLRPPQSLVLGDGGALYLILATLMGALFFIACFSMGVWFSLLRIKGETWWL